MCMFAFPKTLYAGIYMWLSVTVVTGVLNYRWPLARASDAFAAVIPTVMQQYYPFRPLGSIGPSGFLQLALKFPPLNVYSSVSQ